MFAADADVRSGVGGGGGGGGGEEVREDPVVAGKEVVDGFWVGGLRGKAVVDVDDGCVGAEA